MSCKMDLQPVSSHHLRGASQRQSINPSINPTVIILLASTMAEASKASKKKVTNADLGLQRPPSSYALFCQDAAAHGVQWPPVRRVTGKHMVKGKESLQSRWHAMVLDGRAKPYIDQALAINEANKRTRAAVMATRKRPHGDVSSEKPADEPGVELPQFTWQGQQLQTIKVLGRGGNGEVWHVLDPRSDQDFAVKIPRAREENDGVGHHETLLGEYDLLRHLCHPCILRCHGVVVRAATHEQVGLLLPIADMSLHHWLFKNHYATSEKQRAFLTTQLIGAFSYLRKKKIGHLDVKPGNALVKQDLRAKWTLMVSDFGQARTLGETVWADSVGTQGYKPFELIGAHESNKVVRTLASFDVFALGATIFEIFDARDRRAGQLFSDHEVLQSWSKNSQGWEHLRDLVYRRCTFHINHAQTRSLIESCAAAGPSCRIGVDQALQTWQSHEIFM